MQYTNIAQTTSQTMAKVVFFPKAWIVDLLSWHGLLILESKPTGGSPNSLAKRWENNQMITKTEASFMTFPGQKDWLWGIVNHNYIVSMGNTLQLQQYKQPWIEGFSAGIL